MARARLTVAICIAMVVMVAGVAAPAVVRVREASNRMTCANNLKQLAIAAHNYHDAYKVLPPGWWGAIPDTGGITASAVGPGTGPFAQLQAFACSDPFYNQLAVVDRRTNSAPILWDPKKATLDEWCSVYDSKWKLYPNIAAFQVAATDVPFHQLFHQCPTDTDAPIVGDPTPGFGGKAQFIVDSAVTSFQKGGSAGDPKTAQAGDWRGVNWGRSVAGEWSAYFGTLHYDSATQAYNPLARTNYVAVAGLGHGESPFYRQFEGVFTDRSATTLDAIKKADGLATTLLFGETTGQFHPRYTDHAFQVNYFTAALPTHRGLNQRCAPGVQFPGDPAPARDNETFSMALGQRARVNSFSSAHAAGVQFCFCDGSVRMLTRGQTWVKGSQDWYLFQSLAGYHDAFHRDTRSILP